MWEEIKNFFRGLKLLGASFCCLLAFSHGIIGLVGVSKYSGWSAIGLCTGSIAVILIGIFGTWALGAEMKINTKEDN